MINRKIIKVDKSLDDWLINQSNQLGTQKIKITEYLAQYLKNNQINFNIKVKKKNQRGIWIEPDFIPTKEKNNFKSLFNMK